MSISANASNGEHGVVVVADATVLAADDIDVDVESKKCSTSWSVNDVKFFSIAWNVLVLVESMDPKAPGLVGAKKKDFKEGERDNP